MPESTKDYIYRAIEAYDVAATPKVTPIFRFGNVESGSSDFAADESITESIPRSRDGQLRWSIDVKHIFLRFLGDLSARHGIRRSERFLEWFTGYRERSDYGPVHRVQIKNDMRELRSRISNYRSS